VKVRSICALGFFVFLLAIAIPATGAPLPNAGKISGVVRDASGVPQMGATVIISSEQLSLLPSLELRSQQLLTNDRGKFTTGSLPAGDYSVKVTLAGYLPSVEQHIRVSDQQTTLLDIVLGSLFPTFDRMRHDTDQSVPSDEWIWVLRAASASRPVLRWQGGPALGAPMQETIPSAPEDRGRVELTSGSDHPGSISNMGDAPATAFVYDWNLGDSGKLLMAGQFSYDGITPGGGVATEWLPSGELGVGPETTVLVRETRVGIGDGVVFRGLRVSHDDQMTLGDRVTLRYGGEFVMAGLSSSAFAVLPRAEVAVKLSDRWMASATVAARPWQDSATTNDLQSAINTLDSLPTLLLRKGRPVLSDNLHEEIAVERILSKSETLTAAVFHDRTSNTAVFGEGNVSGPDFLPDIYSNVFAYDAGSTQSMGARLAYTKKFSDYTDASVIYAFGGVLAPLAGMAAASAREELGTQYRSSVAARASMRLPKLHTKVTTGYKWVEGQAVSRLDPYGESVYHIDPYWSLEIRQPLPYVWSGHMEAMVDVGNLLAQGYVPLKTSDGSVILIPSCRYLRGGFSFQF
jgi:hypothetical protein